MKVLIVCSKNSGKIAPFITDQVNGLNKKGVETAYFTIEQKGINGYINSNKGLLRKIREFRPDIIHAHYGLSGLLANLQRKVPIVTTYHGSDINNNKAFRFSNFSIFLSKYNIFVSQKNINKAKVKHKYSLIPCGVDTSIFYPMGKDIRREKINLEKDRKYILFAGGFDNKVKNAQLAQYAVKRNENIELMQLKGYSREEVALLMNTVDVCLMTSHTEGSPQFIKEAMACNCPIVSVNVGDVEEVIGKTEGCYVCETYNVDEVAEKLNLALLFGKRTNGRERIIELGLDAESISKKLIDIYTKVKVTD